MRRKTAFETGECYHIFNRGTDKREIFLDAGCYERFLLSLRLMNDKNNGLMAAWKNFHKVNSNVILEEFLKQSVKKIEPIVDIIAYCLNPNHYHLILKQIRNKGIEEFMQKIGNGYAKYFNKKNDRSGVLFQGPFKSIHVDSNEYLLYVSAYVNKNNFIHGYETGDKWKYSSFSEYLSQTKEEICKKEIVLGQFKNIDEFKEFTDANAEYLKTKKELEKYLLD